MLNITAIEEAYQEAVYAYEDKVRLTELNNSIKSKTRECDHENARRKKDGARDKRYPCADCLDEREVNELTIECIDLDYQDVWRFFKKVGSPVDKEV